ncbi:MAG: rod shape-determining protein MreD [Cyanobacteriota bacterium]|nr:rod shape-determining protein MreD [Cyanobacteriota bacterium]
MAALSRQGWCMATALIVPLLTLASPSLLKLGGVSPAWAVIWLLPWALVDGPVSGAIAGGVIGLVLDDLQIGPVSQIPALALLGWWWGRIGINGPQIRHGFSLGLLALLGTLFLGGTLLAQFLLWGEGIQPQLHTLLAQTLITALLAPLLCSLQLLFWRHQTNGLQG